MKHKHNQTFEQLYKNYYSRLAAYASFFLKNDDAHDVVQDVFLNMLEKSEKMFDESKINSYLYRAVHNKCVDAIRHKTVEEKYNSAIGKKLFKIEAEYIYTSRNEIEDALMSKELQQLINNAIEMLPPKGREVFKLYFEHQKTAKEIASIMKISRSTVENHIYVCIRVLRQKLIKYKMM